MEGSILLHRRLLDSSVFSSEKRLKIWIWLLLKASYKERFTTIKIGKGEQTIKIERGQLIFGRYKAEESLSIDGSTIYKILQWMESEDMIKIESNSHYTILTINNYNSFQNIENEKVTATQQPLNSHSTATQQPLNTYNKVNKVNKVNKEYNPESFLIQEFCKPHFEKKYINEKSLDCFNKLINLDKYTSNQIKEAILNARSEPFWDANFISPCKLRDKDKNGVKYIDRFLKLKKSSTKIEPAKSIVLNYLIDGLKPEYKK